MNLDTFFKAEQAPFLQTYNGTRYFDKSTAKYIHDMNLQRGMWRNDTQNDFLGYDPPSATVYTGKVIIEKSRGARHN